MSKWYGINIHESNLQKNSLTGCFTHKQLSSYSLRKMENRLKRWNNILKVWGTVSIQMPSGQQLYILSEEAKEIILRQLVEELSQEIRWFKAIRNIKFDNWRWRRRDAECPE